MQVGKIRKSCKSGKKQEKLSRAAGLIKSAELAKVQKGKQRREMPDIKRLTQ